MTVSHRNAQHLSAAAFNEGRSNQDVMAVTPTEIVLSERGYPDGFNDQILRFVRLDLAQLDTLERAW